MNFPLLLLVDDSLALLHFEQEALGGLYRTVLAANGREAMQAMAGQVPDGVLLDLSMPLMDGDEVLKAMRADPRLAGVPVLLVSSEEARARDCLRMASGFLAKPFDASRLRAQVAAMLEAAQDRAAQQALSCLPVGLAGARLAFRLQDVERVALRCATRPLEPGRPGLAAAIAIQGQDVPVLDLAGLLGMQFSAPLLERRYVVLRAAGCRYALEVDEVEEPVTLGGESRPSWVPDAVPWGASATGLLPGGSLLMDAAKLWEQHAR